jgi:hypothetical protein
MHDKKREALVMYVEIDHSIFILSKLLLFLTVRHFAGYHSKIKRYKYSNDIFTTHKANKLRCVFPLMRITV